MNIFVYIYTVKSQRNWYRHSYANADICKHSEYGAGYNAYIRPQVLVAGGRLVKAATVEGFHDLGELQRDDK